MTESEKKADKQMAVKEEMRSENEINSIKKESSVDLRNNIEKRWGFDICKQDSELAVHVPEI